MPGPKPPPLHLSAAERAALDQVVRRHSTPQPVALRCRIVLAAADGLNHTEIGRAVDRSDETAALWRQRWLAFQAIPLAELAVAERLADLPRPGAPARFLAEQVCQMVALACAAPGESGRPIRQWSQREIADEIIKRGIVETISPRQAGRLFKGGRSHTPPDSLLVDAHAR